MRVFIDTNIFLDYVESRPVGVKEATEIFMLAAKGELTLMVSDLTIANVKYCTRKTIPDSTFYATIKDLRELFLIVSVGEAAVDRALDIEADDFEDALQYFSAVQANADCIVTRNTKDFSFAEIKVITPQEFVRQHYWNT